MQKLFEDDNVYYGYYQNGGVSNFDIDFVNCYAYIVTEPEDDDIHSDGVN